MWVICILHKELISYWYTLYKNAFEYKTTGVSMWIRSDESSNFDQILYNIVIQNILVRLNSRARRIIPLNPLNRLVVFVRSFTVDCCIIANFWASHYYRGLTTKYNIDFNYTIRSLFECEFWFTIDCVYGISLHTILFITTLPDFKCHANTSLQYDNILFRLLLLLLPILITR